VFKLFFDKALAPTIGFALVGVGDPQGAEERDGSWSLRSATGCYAKAASPESGQRRSRRCGGTNGDATLPEGVKGRLSQPAPFWYTIFIHKE